MSNKKEYSQVTLTNAVKYLIDVVQNEITTNTDTIEYLSSLKDEFNHDIYDDINLNVDKTKEILIKKQIEDKKVQYFNEYSHNLDKLIIFRNFILVLSFFKQLVNTNDDKRKSIRGILKTLLYRKDSLLRQNLVNDGGTDYSRKDNEYIDFNKITMMFSKFLESKNYNHNISINFESLVLSQSQAVRRLDNSGNSPLDIDKIKVDRFITRMNVLLNLPRIEESISIFFKVSGSSVKRSAKMGS